MLTHYEIPYIDGTFKTAIDPNHLKKDNSKTNYKFTQDTTTLSITSAEELWYINDHCILQDENGILHFFGIHNPYPNQGQELYDFHPYIAHYTASTPFGPWQYEGMAIDESAGTNYLGAPFVTYVQNRSQYVMIFESKLNNERSLEIAVSNDLYNWTREYNSILTNLNTTKRDPCIIKEGDDYLLYLCNPTASGSSIVCVTTKNFRTFTTVECLFIDDGSNYGGVESPFVLKHNQQYYLFFTYAHRHYYETIVLVSENPRSFTMDNQVTTLHGHASEIFTYQNQHYITSCGPEDMQEMNPHGLEIVKLNWIR